MSMNRLLDLSLVCARNDSHKIFFNLHLEDTTIQKVGQIPSFADIALDESKDYSKLLDKEDTSEFHKAIGLAAHGVGIGSYVYLRRIFERLIAKRFAEYKEVEGWDEAAFRAMRMKERIEHLKDHLPEFLVSNAKLYSILSLGRRPTVWRFSPCLSNRPFGSWSRTKRNKRSLPNVSSSKPPLLSLPSLGRLIPPI